MEKNGQKTSMKDIADELGVSINAVSLALNNKAGVSEELRMKALRTADRLGYLGKRDRFVRTFRSTNFCVMMQKSYHADMYFYAKLLYGATEEARRKGYDCIMHFFDEQDGAFAVPDCVEWHRVAGIIVVGKISDGNIARLLPYGIPIVLVDHASFVHPVHGIVSDGKSGGFLATLYLIDNGFDKIGFLGDLDYSLSIKERHFGYRNALEGLSPQAIKNCEAMSLTCAGLEKLVLKNDIAALCELLRDMPRLPQAFVCSNDFAAIMLINAARALHIAVPDEMSVIGFDDIELCKTTVPKLTTLDVGREHMGRKAVEQLIHIIGAKGDVHVENIVTHVKLVERESVKIKNKPL